MPYVLTMAIHYITNCNDLRRVFMYAYWFRTYKAFGRGYGTRTRTEIPPADFKSESATCYDNPPYGSGDGTRTHKHYFSQQFLRLHSVPFEYPAIFNLVAWCWNRTNLLLDMSQIRYLTFNPQYWAF